MAVNTPRNVANDIVDFTNINRLCRICLTKSTSMIPLSSPLSKEISGKPSILEALEKVMSVRISKDKKYPLSVCAMCKGLLKISYDLHILFSNSQTAMIEYFDDFLLENRSRLNSIKDAKTVAPVELIFRNNRYSLNDVVIVEDDKEEKHNFQGFLSNLGTSISAVFVNKSDSPKKHNDLTQNVNNCFITLEPFDTNVPGNVDDAVVEISLDELQGCNLSDLFPDYQIFNVLPESEESEGKNSALAANNPQLIKNAPEIWINNSELGQSGQEVESNNHRVEESAAIEQPAEEPSDRCLDRENLILRKIYKCEACDLLCANRARLKVHLRKIHIQQVPYLCDICSSVSFHADKETPQAPLPDILSCEECGSTNTSRKIFASGKKGAEVVKKVVREYLCQICGQISKNAKNAWYHKNKHYEIQYHCNICDKKYHSKTTLQWHLNKHNKVKNLLCTMCGKKFNYYSSLMHHMKTHSNDRKFMCDICDKRFYMHNSLKRHIRTHTGERPYICNHCGKGFPSPEEKKKHERIHTGLRPFKCKYCDKGFTSSFNKKLHEMSHPGPHECCYCSKTFMEIDFLKNHLKTKHKDLVADLK